MRALAVVCLLVAVLTPSPAAAQQWSPEQQEVLAFELGCQANKEAWLDCFHEDYVAWGNGDLGVPVNKDDVVAIGARSWDVDEVLLVHLKVLDINLRGNLAIALVVYTETRRNGDTGEVTTVSTRWTDVCLKEDGRWAWIADHGGPVGN